MPEAISYEEFIDRCERQRPPLCDNQREWKYVAFKCPICGTVQNALSLVRAGVHPDKVDEHIGYNCVGRALGSGPFNPDKASPHGCDWTLGGLFKIHNLEVVHVDHVRRCFELASADEALDLMQRQLADDKVIV